MQIILGNLQRKRFVELKMEDELIWLYEASQWTDLACTVPPSGASCLLSKRELQFCANNVTFCWSLQEISHPFPCIQFKGQIHCRALDTDGLTSSRTTQQVDARLSYLLSPVVTVPCAAILYSAVAAVLIRVSHFQLLVNSSCTVACRKSFPKTYKQPEVQLLMIKCNYTRWPL